MTAVSETIAIKQRLLLFAANLEKLVNEVEFQQQNRRLESQQQQLHQRQIQQSHGVKIVQNKQQQSIQLLQEKQQQPNETNTKRTDARDAVLSPKTINTIHNADGVEPTTQSRPRESNTFNSSTRCIGILPALKNRNVKQLRSIPPSVPKDVTNRPVQTTERILVCSPRPINCVAPVQGTQPRTAPCRLADVSNMTNMNAIEKMQSQVTTPCQRKGIQQSKCLNSAGTIANDSKEDQPSQDRNEDGLESTRHIRQSLSRTPSTSRSDGNQSSDSLRQLLLPARPIGSGSAQYRQRQRPRPARHTQISLCDEYLDNLVRRHAPSISSAVSVPQRQSQERSQTRRRNVHTPSHPIFRSVQEWLNRYDEQEYQFASEIRDENAKRVRQREAQQVISTLSSYSPEEVEGTQGCCICLDQYEVGCQLSVLPCGHSFHYNCICKWLSYCILCPLCKHPAGQTTT